MPTWEEEHACTMKRYMHAPAICTTCQPYPFTEREIVAILHVPGTNKHFLSTAHFPHACVTRVLINCARDLLPIWQEMLGYDRVRTAVVDSSYYVTEYAALDQCGGITPEAWFTAPINMSLLAKLPEPGMAISDHLGAVGEEGMYVPAYMPFRAASAESLRMHPELLATLPPDGTVGPDELDGFFPEGDPWGCSNETTNWDVSTCNTGRWCVRG